MRRSIVRISIKPEEDGKVTALAEFEDAEEQRIHLARVQLARDSWF